MLRPKRLVAHPCGFLPPARRAVTPHPVARLGRGLGPAPGRVTNTGDVPPDRTTLQCAADVGGYASGEPPRGNYRGGGGLRT